MRKILILLFLDLQIFKKEKVCQRETILLGFLEGKK